MINDIQFAVLKTFSSAPEIKNEGGEEFIFLPRLLLPTGCIPQTCDALLCAHARDGYETRLFLSAKCKQNINWTEVRIMERQWFVMSYQGVPANLPLDEILFSHLSPLK
jgi:hypothetical protein